MCCFVGLKDGPLMFALDSKNTIVHCMSAVDGSLHYMKTNKIADFKPFTCLQVNNNEIYAGSTNGSVYVFESRSGEYLKEIPF